MRDRSTRGSPDPYLGDHDPSGGRPGEGDQGGSPPVGGTLDPSPLPPCSLDERKDEKADPSTWMDVPVTVHVGDCLEVLRTLEAESIDALVTDPPAGIAFMGKKWDNFARGGRGAVQDGTHPVGSARDVHWQYSGAARQGFIALLTAVAEECLRVLKPGAHGVVWAIPRTSHWTAMALEDAGFEVRDVITHHFGCLSEDTEILVNERWEPYRNCAVGGRALAYNVECDEFRWEPIQEVYLYPDYSDTAFRLRGDHTDQLVSRGHRCLVERDGAYVFERAEEAARQRQARVPVLEDVSTLLAALPLPDEGAGGEEPDVLESLPGSEHFGATPTAEGPAVMRLVSATLHPQEQSGARQGALLLSGARREDEGIPSRLRGEDAVGRRNGSRGLDESECGLLLTKDDRREEPGLEGWGDLLPEARGLSAHQVRPLPAGIPTDGAEGWVRDGTPAPGSAGDWALPTTGRGRASRQPEPAGQSAREPAAIRQQSRPQAVRASRFTRSDLVRIDAVEYRDLVWCVRVPSGAFVARRNGKVFVTGNSGFPKSLDVSKAIDRAAQPNIETGRRIAAVGEVIRKHREAKGLTPQQVSLAIVGTPSGACWNWENIQLPSLTNWPQIKAALDISDEFDALLEGDRGRFIAAEREVIGARRATSGVAFDPNPRRPIELPVTAPATDAAKQWQGWGTALKPASEHWILVRKPLAKPTVASQVLATGTGALNIDGSRVGTGGRPAREVAPLRGDVVYQPNSLAGRVDGPLASSRAIGVTQLGRFPANLVLSHAEGCREVGVRKVRGSPSRIPTGSRASRALDFPMTDGNGGYADPDGTETVTAWECVKEGCPVAEVDRQSGERPGMGEGRLLRRGATTGTGMGYGSSSPQDAAFVGYADSGGASRFFATFGPEARFFYTAKASTSERSMGLSPGLRNTHVTVKPVALMRYLARLITPPGGTILDPFAGSGTTGVAATLEGFDAVLIEQDAEWEPVIKARVAWAGHQAELASQQARLALEDG